MSPDQYYKNGRVEQLNAFAVRLQKSMPQACDLLMRHADDFNGIFIMLSDNGGVLGGIKKFGEDGAPLIAWFSGDDPIEALYNLDRRFHVLDWKPDKPKKKKSGRKITLEE